MDPQRLEFLKQLIRFFRQNPQATHFRGITKKDCLSFLTHHLGLTAPEAALDPQDPSFLNQAQRQVDLYEQGSPQRSPLSLPRAPTGPQAAQQQPAQPQQPVQPQQPQKPLSQAEIMEELKNHALGKKKLSQRELEKHFEAVVKHYLLQKFPFLQRAVNIKNAVLGLPGKALGWGWKKLATFTATPRAKIGGAIRAVFSLPKKALRLAGKGLVSLTAYPRAKVAAAVRKVVSLPGRALGFGKRKLAALTATPRSFIRTKISAVKGTISAFGTKVKMAAGPVGRAVYAVPGVKTLGTGITKTGKAFSRAGGVAIGVAIKVTKAPLKVVSKVVGFAGKVLGKVAAVVTFVKATINVAYKIIKKALKYIGIPILGLYAFMAFLGSAAFIGAAIGGVVGGIAGGIAGAIIGAKVGAALGAAIGSIIPGVGTAIGAVVGGIAGGITGFVIGALAGTFIGAAIGGAIGYTWDKWIAPTAQNIWTGAGNLWAGAGNALTGAWTATGNFFGGLWTGAGNLLSGAGSLASGAATAAGNALTGAWTATTTWAGGAASSLSISAANLASGALSAASGAVTATVSTASGFLNALSSVSLAQAATVPVLGAVGVAGGFTLFLGPMIVGTGFMRPPPPAQIAVPPSPYGACSLTADTAPRSATLTQLFIDAGQWAGIPPAVLAAIAYIEGGHMFGYTDSQIQQYSAPGAQDPINCSPNGCGARGPMQFLNDGVATDCGIYTGKVMPDTWSAYSSAVNNALPSEPRTPEICNIKDSIYAAAWLIKSASGVADNATCIWDRATIDRVATAYYGSTACTEIHASLGNQTYCQFIWDYYQAHSVQNPAPPPPTSGWFFWQGDPQWGWYSDNLICSPPATIGNNGCGPTSLAMVFTRFGVATSPTQMYDEFISRSAIGCAGSYNYQSTFIDLPLSRGFTSAQGISNDWAVVESYIRNGYLVIASTNQYSASGHLLVIKDIQGDNVITNDPAISNGEGKSYAKTEVVWYAFWALRR